MLALTAETLARIANTYGIDYDAQPEEVTDTERIVTTKISRVFPIDRQAAYTTFADPQNHTRYFDIIKGSTPLIPLEGALPKDEYIVLEHVQEAQLPSRMMLVKYKLEPPNTIVKEALTDPFSEDDPLSDKKRGKVRLSFEELGRNSTRVTCESTFKSSLGPVFVRGFIDHVWFNFFEKLMVETGEIERGQMLTGDTAG